MTYSILAQHLHSTADKARDYLRNSYGAQKFQCEQPIDASLPLKPTWQASLSEGGLACIDVRETPFSNTLHEFVTKCAAQGLPIQLWVAVPDNTGPSFAAELKDARDVGIGVVQINDYGVHEFQRPVSLSLFGLRRTDLSKVPRTRREAIKNAEATFLEGTPDQGCQAVCQELEDLTRAFAEYTHAKGWWRQGSTYKASFFQTDSWAVLLEQMERMIDTGKVKAASPLFSKQMVIKVRGQTDWRNSVSHKPKTLKERRERDAKLRTNFEVTRDQLLEWFQVCRPLRLVK